MDRFNYVIAAPWPNSDGGLCVYTHYNAVHFGNEADADASLDYVKAVVSKEERSKFQPKAEDFRIYKVVPYEV